MHPTMLDHVAIAVPGRDEMAGWLCQAVGLRVIQRTDRLTLLGSSATAGKITLFDAVDGPGSTASTGRVDCLVALQLAGPARDTLVHPDGLVLEFVAGAAGTEHNALVGVRLHSDDPVAAAAAYAARWGFEAGAGHDGIPSVRLGEARVTFERDAAPSGSVLVDHLGLLVASAAEHASVARAAGVDVQWVDAPNTLAAFVTGPDGVRLEYVEHKPEFALT